MNVPWLGGARYFVAFINEASCHDQAFHMKRKSQAAQPLRSHAPLVERQTEVSVKKVVPDGRKKYQNRSNGLKEDDIEISTTAKYTPQENRRRKKINRTIKNVILAFLIHAGAPANLWAECFYTVCDPLNQIVRMGELKTLDGLLTCVKPSVLNAHISM